MSNTLRTIALIVAAGSGERLGADVPKAYVTLAGESVLRRCVKTFAAHPGIDGVRVVISRVHHPLYRREIEGLTLIPCVAGGATRQESVRRGLESLARRGCERVLIHDAARPLASHALISRVLEKLEESQAAYPALPVADTLRRANHQTVPRDGLYQVQTPQGFHFQPILKAHTDYRDAHATDDIALAHRAGLAIGVVPGERSNLKLTSPDDLTWMETLIHGATHF